MERNGLATLAAFFADRAALAPGTLASLGEDAAHHMRVRRLAAGDRVMLADGAGHHAVGSIVRLSKGGADVSIDDVASVDRLPAVHMVVPVADRDRMLWCAEKCTELGAASWRPVLWNRSRSVSPRGEGEAFAARVRARMTSALLQSHGGWLPDLHVEAPPARVLADAPLGTRLALDPAGEPIARVSITAPVTIAIGPEGGLEPEERRLLSESSFQTVSLGANVLRFETAAVAALAIVQSALAALPETPHG